MMSFGQNNYSMNFDGVDDYIQLGNASFLPNNSFTISTWFNSLGVTSGTDDIFVSDASWSTYTIRMGPQGNISFRIQPNAGSGGGVTVIETSGNGINYSDGNWHHLTCTWDGNNMAVYINGLLFSQVSTSFNSVGFTNDNATIGSYPLISPSTNEEFFNGKLDDFQIWNIALSEQDIQQYMNCPPTGNETGLVAYWNFEEGSGTTALDLTSNGNDGTINGATYSTDVPVQNCCTTDTSYTDVTVCDTTYLWNDSTYSQSGTYTLEESSNNNYSMNFDGADDWVSINDNDMWALESNDFTISADINIDNISNPSQPSSHVGIIQQFQNNSNKWQIYLFNNEIYFGIKLNGV